MPVIETLRRYRAAYLVWLEVFVIFNYLTLIMDIYIAHSANQFRRSEEYIPLYFSMIAPVLLLIGLIARERWQWSEVWRDFGHLVGWVSVFVGMAGVIFHLDSQFFYEKTLRSLTYAAPFAAPLAYTGVGLLLIVNRIVESDSREWGYWLLVLTAGGYFGNFVLSLTDHATNGFFSMIEWLPVISGAFAASFLIVPVFISVPRGFFRLCAGILLFQAAVGLLGFLLHARQNLRQASLFSFDTLINGAPPLAPLLFANLVPLGLIALWVLDRHYTAQ
jgi:hypothetical protein